MVIRSQITPLRRTDIPELSQFLIKGFGLPATSSCFSHEVLSWKYFDGPGGPSTDSLCSLVTRSAGSIIGHIGICPRQFVVSGGESTIISTIHAMDWLGSTTHSGSGAFLMLQAFAKSQTQYAVGGSEQAQSVFPKLGFEKKANLVVYRKILAPFHRLRLSDQGTLRKWAGTAKDVATVWRTRTSQNPQTIELRSVTSFTEEIDVLFRQCSLRMITCLRDHMLLNYFLRYPLPEFSGWTIHSSDRMIGFAVLKISSDRGVRIGKIVDCWVHTEDPILWQAAVAELTDRLQVLSADVVTCYGASPSLQAALLGNGFAKSAEKNVYVRDKQGSLPLNLRFALSMLEADHAVL